MSDFRKERYDGFLHFITDDIQKERRLANRKIFSVFFWCFFLPAFFSASALLLIKYHLLPNSLRSYLDWLVLIFPVSYSIYVLGADLIAEVPAAVRKGTIAASLKPAYKENAWRDRVCHALQEKSDLSAIEWRWVSASFRIDLKRLQNRTRYLTALAGAVFFLIMQGIDSIGDQDNRQVWINNPVLDWVHNSASAVSQIVGLALFLLLLYLSGSQTYHSLERYLDCAELILAEKEKSL